MAGFHHTGGGLSCDDVRLADVARAAGTPVYVYSANLITERFADLDRAYAGYPHRLHYAIKANATVAVVRHMADSYALMLLTRTRVWSVRCPRVRR